MHGSRAPAVLLCLFLAAGAARSEERAERTLPPPAPPGEVPDLTADMRQILLPLVTGDMLAAGGGDGSGLARYTVHLDVATHAAKGGWTLYVRPEQPVFRPEGAGKPCSDLRWKLDREDPHSYRPLDDHETIVLANPAGGDARVTIDIAVGLGWRTGPGTYDLGLVFRVAAL
jgi:hypothetical protein